MKPGKTYRWISVTPSPSAVPKQAPSTPSTSGQTQGSAAPSSSGQQQGNSTQPITSSAQIPKVLQNWGMALARYDAATGMAGVMKLTGFQPPVVPSPRTELYRLLVWPYAIPIMGKPEVGIFLVAPLGTKIVSMLDGTVCALDRQDFALPDVGLRIAPKGMACSHGSAQVLVDHFPVHAPSVQVGQEVTAGQEIGTISAYNGNWAAKGFGHFTIGVAFDKHDGSPAVWVCPSLILAPAKEVELLNTLASIQQGWAGVLGDSTLNTVAQQNPVGCLSRAEFSG